MNWNYYETFITVAGDCAADKGVVPPDKKDGKTKPGIEFDLLYHHPYVYTQEDILYETYIRHKGIPEEELEARGTQIRDEFFQKSQACLRASMLPKKYGWGIHFDKDGKAALYGVETPEYRAFAERNEDGLKILPAMRNKKDK